MPTVQNYGNTKIRTEALPGARLTAAPTEETFGVAGGNKLAAVGARLYEDEILRQDQVAVLEADRKLSEWENTRLYDPKSGALNVRGKDAFGLPDTVGKDFDTFRDEVRAGLTTERQRVAFDRQAMSRKSDIDKTLSRHVFGEVRKFDDAETENYILNSRQSAISNANDPDRIGLEIERQNAAIVDYAKRNGLGAEYIKQKTAQAKSDTHVGVVDRMLAQGNDLGAKAYFDKVKPEIAGNDIAKVESKLLTASTDADGARAADEIWQSLGPKSDIAPINLDKMMEQARTKYADDPKRLKATREALSERANIHNAAQRERRESNGSAVWAAIEQGATLARMRSMPEFLALPGQEQAQIKEHVIDRAHAMKQRAEGEGDDALYYNLLTEASSPATRDKFAQRYLLNDRTKLSRSQFNQLAELQASIRKGDGKAEERLDGYRTNTEIVNDTLREAGIDPTPKDGSSDAKRVGAFRRSVDEAVARYERQSGKKADNAAIQSIADGLIISGKVPGSGWIVDDTRRVFELKDGESIVIKPADVPRAERIKIEEALRRQGRAVTPDAVVTLYTAKVMNLRGTPPAAPSLVDRIPK